VLAEPAAIDEAAQPGLVVSLAAEPLNLLASQLDSTQMANRRDQIRNYQEEVEVKFWV
jgi:hypothetical protein